LFSSLDTLSASTVNIYDSFVRSRASNFKSTVQLLSGVYNLDKSRVGTAVFTPVTRYSLINSTNSDLYNFDKSLISGELLKLNVSRSLVSGSDIRAGANASNSTVSDLMAVGTGITVTRASTPQAIIGRNNAIWTDGNTTTNDGNERIFVIGNGTTTAARSNALYLTQNGKLFLPAMVDGDLYIESGEVKSKVIPTYVATAVSLTANATQSTINVTATGQTITLPTAVGIQGKVYVIKFTAVGSVTVATTSAQTIDGATTAVLSTQYESITVQSTGANWIII